MAGTIPSGSLTKRYARAWYQNMPLIHEVPLLRQAIRQLGREDPKIDAFLQSVTFGFGLALGGWLWKV